MLYMILGEDASDSAARRAAARPAHLLRARELADAGRMVLAGPLPAIDSADPGPAGVTGSLIVAEFESLDAAQAWAAADPYASEGVFATMTVRPFRKVFPA